MGLRINTNVYSLNAQRNLTRTSKALGKALERLSSGSRINRAGDDPAGLAISEGLNSQVRGVRVAIRNSNDALGYTNTAEGALSELTNIAQRLRELAIQSANGTLGTSDRSYLDQEKTSLLAEFDRIASQTDFNGTKLLDGTFSTSDLQVGVNKGETISLYIGSARATALGTLATISGIQHALSASNGNLVFNGGSVSIAAASDSDDTLSYSGNSYSAIAIAKKINEKSGQTGVYADVLSTIVRFGGVSFNLYQGGATSGTLATGEFKINNVSVTGAVTSNSAFIAAVNAVSSQTGVRAQLATGTTDEIQLVAADGRNIRIDIYSAITLASASFNSVGAGIAAASQLGTVGSASSITFSTGTLVSAGFTLVSSGAIRLRSSSAIITAGTNASLAIGVSAQTVAVDTSTTLNNISLSTQTTAQSALPVLDAVLNSLNSLRSGLGAIQSRIDSTVNNLGNLLENLSNARSQIKDADIAAETAELTRAQIMQQAGVAVLGQANTVSQVALQLLRF